MVKKIPRVSIVILNWNSWRDTVACVESVLAVAYPSFEIIVVDNGSSDHSVIEIRKWLEARGVACLLSGREESDTTMVYALGRQPRLGANKEVVLIETGKNLGYTGGNNAGIRYSLRRGADYVLVLNEDTRVSRDFLTKMVDTGERDPKVGLVGCRICVLEDPSRSMYDGQSMSLWLGVHGSFRSERGRRKNGEIDVNYIPGCAVLIKKELLQSIGLLEESYFLYADDVEFPFRALKNGWRVRVNLDATIWHRAVPERGRRSLSYYYYGTRNLLYFICGHLRGFQRASCLVFFLTGRLVLILEWLLRGKYDYIKASSLGAWDYWRGITGPKESRLARHDERVHIQS